MLVIEHQWHISFEYVLVIIDHENFVIINNENFVIIDNENFVIIDNENFVIIDNKNFVFTDNENFVSIDNEYFVTSFIKVCEVAMKLFKILNVLTKILTLKTATSHN
jgi:hypothetical protein